MSHLVPSKWHIKPSGFFCAAEPVLTMSHMLGIKNKIISFKKGTITSPVTFTINSVKETGFASMPLHGQVDILLKGLFLNDPQITASLYCNILLS